MGGFEMTPFGTQEPDNRSIASIRADMAQRGPRGSIDPDEFREEFDRHLRPGSTSLSSGRRSSSPSGGRYGFNTGLGQPNGIDEQPFTVEETVEDSEPSGDTQQAQEQSQAAARAESSLESLTNPADIARELYSMWYVHEMDQGKFPVNQRKPFIIRQFGVPTPNEERAYEIVSQQLRTGEIHFRMIPIRFDDRGSRIPRRDINGFTAVFQVNQQNQAEYRKLMDYDTRSRKDVAEIRGPTSQGRLAEFIRGKDLADQVTLKVIREAEENRKKDKEALDKSSADPNISSWNAQIKQLERELVEIHSSDKENKLHNLMYRLELATKQKNDQMRRIAIQEIGIKMCLVRLRDRHPGIVFSREFDMNSVRGMTLESLKAQLDTLTAQEEERPNQRSQRNPGQGRSQGTSDTSRNAGASHGGSQPRGTSNAQGDRNSRRGATAQSSSSGRGSTSGSSGSASDATGSSSAGQSTSRSNDASGSTGQAAGQSSQTAQGTSTSGRDDLGGDDDTAQENSGPNLRDSWTRHVLFSNPEARNEFYTMFMQRVAQWAVPTGKGTPSMFGELPSELVGLESFDALTRMDSQYEINPGPQTFERLYRAMRAFQMQAANAGYDLFHHQDSASEDYEDGDYIDTTYQNLGNGNQSSPSTAIIPIRGLPRNS